MSLLHDLNEDLAARDATRLRRQIPCDVRRGPGWIEIDGARLVDFSSNDYLGLSFEPSIRDAARAAIEKYGTGACASRLISGNSELHEELEGEIARFKGTESALLFPSGFAAGSGLLGTLPREGDVVFVDRLAHACLLDGARSSAGKFRVFPHNDVDRLADLLRRAKDARARWIVVDGLYSMDGDVAPLPELLRLADEFDATVIVDDAHGTGTLGPSGEGTAAHFGIRPADHAERLIIVATLSKALGAQGGVVLGARALREWCVNSVRTQIYSTGLSPAAAGAALAAVRIIVRNPGRVHRLKNLAASFRHTLGASSVPVLGGESAILPIMCPGPSEALALGDAMRTAGFAGAAIRPPTVPEGACRVRLSLSAAHADEDVSRAAAFLAEYFVASRKKRESSTCS